MARGQQLQPLNLTDDERAHLLSFVPSANERTRHRDASAHRLVGSGG
jgi:hypothetical protein